MITTAGWGILFRLAGLWPRATGRWWRSSPGAPGSIPEWEPKPRLAYRVFFRHYPQFRDALLVPAGPVSGPGDPSEPAGGPGPGLSMPPPGAGSGATWRRNPELAASYYRHGYTRMAALWAGAPGIFEWEVGNGKDKTAGGTPGKALPLPEAGRMRNNEMWLACMQLPDS